MLLRLPARGRRRRGIRHGGVVIAVAAVRLHQLLSKGGIDAAKLLDESVTGGLCHLPRPQPRLGIPEPRACPEDGPQVGIVREAVPGPPRDDNAKGGVIDGHDP